MLTCGNATSLQPPPIDRKTPPLTCSNPAQPRGVPTLDAVVVGDPIEPATGQQSLREVDYVDHSPHPLNFARYYRSAPNDPYASTSAELSPLGVYWSHNWWSQITPPAPDASGPRLVMMRDDVQFNKLFLPTLLSYPSTFAPVMPDYLQQGYQLIQQGSGWTVTMPDDDRAYTFNATGPNSTGQLATVTERNGWVMTYSYNSAGQLTQVTNQFGRTMGFAYNAAGQLVQVNPPDGSTITYSYDSQARLTQVNYPDGSYKNYLYENTTFPNALTGVTVNGVRDSTFA